MTLNQIAQVLHEANAAICRAYGDDSQPSWSNIQDWQKKSALESIKFNWESLKSGIVPDPATNHNDWCFNKRKDGWTYGSVKDPAKKTHPCLVPFEQLSEADQMKDRLHGAIIRAFFECAQSLDIDQPANI